jgi:hypothetical protein
VLDEFSPELVGADAGFLFQDAPDPSALIGRRVRLSPPTSHQRGRLNGKLQNSHHRARPAPGGCDHIKEPIGEGEVIALPFGWPGRCRWRVESTDADVTVELASGTPAPLAAPIALVAANDKDALAALAKLGAEIPAVPEGAVVELADVPGVDLLASVSIQLSDGRLSEYDVAAILTPEQRCAS